VQDVDEGQKLAFEVQPPCADPAAHAYGAVHPQWSASHWAEVHRGHAVVGGSGGPGGGGDGAVWSTMEAHHGIVTPPRMSRVQFGPGTNGCPVSASFCIQFPHQPWSPLNPQPWARASLTVKAWQFEVNTRQYSSVTSNQTDERDAYR
jgi:hypothetical protein